MLNQILFQLGWNVYVGTLFFHFGASDGQNLMYWSWELAHFQCAFLVMRCSSTNWHAIILCICLFFPGFLSLKLTDTKLHKLQAWILIAQWLQLACTSCWPKISCPNLSEVFYETIITMTFWWSLLASYWVVLELHVNNQRFCQLSRITLRLAHLF